MYNPFNFHDDLKQWDSGLNHQSDHFEQLDRQSEKWKDGLVDQNDG
jgi:hypothetical protein